MELALRLANFFAEYPGYEVRFADVTAEKARALHSDVVTAEQRVRGARADANAMKTTRDLAEKRLRMMMRRVRLLLSIPLGKSDPRWLAFGLKRPSANSQPVHHNIHASPTEPLQVHFNTTPTADAAIA